jgi:replication factor C small subunit
MVNLILGDYTSRVVHSLEPVLWSIKYRPKTWTDFYGQDTAIEELRNLAESKTAPHLILYGPSGTGKTIAARIYAQHLLGDSFTSNFKILNIRDLRSYSLTNAKRNIQALAKLDRTERTELDEYMSVVYREAKASLSSKGRTGDPNRSQLLHQAISLFSSTSTVTNELVKILVLDEADALDTNMLQALRRTMEIYSGVCRFILITPSLAGWNPAIASRCIVMKFPAAKPDAVKALISHVSAAESVDIDAHGMEALMKESRGDMRRALNLLQICASTGKPVTEDLVFSHSDTPLTAGVRKMISLSLDNNFPKARDTLRDLLTSEQYSPGDVLVQMQREIVKRPLEERKMRHLMDRIAEIDYRMVQGKNPHIHLTALLASISNAVQAD